MLYFPSCSVCKQSFEIRGDKVPMICCEKDTHVCQACHATLCGDMNCKINEPFCVMAQQAKQFEIQSRLLSTILDNDPKEIHLPAVPRPPADIPASVSTSSTEETHKTGSLTRRTLTKNNSSRKRKKVLIYM